MRKDEWNSWISSGADHLFGVVNDSIRGEIAPIAPLEWRVFKM
jgi:hypothetical protein